MTDETQSRAVALGLDPRGYPVPTGLGVYAGVRWVPWSTPALDPDAEVFASDRDGELVDGEAEEMTVLDLVLALSAAQGLDLADYFQTQGFGIEWAPGPT